MTPPLIMENCTIFLLRFAAGHWPARSACSALCLQAVTKPQAIQMLQM